MTPRDETDDYTVSKLAHAIRIGGPGFAAEVMSAMSDLTSDAERKAIMEWAATKVVALGPIDPVTPGALPLERIADLLGAPETFWTVRSWISQGAPHEGYGSSLRCDPVALARWCEAKADSITSEPARSRFRTLAQRLAEAA